MILTGITEAMLEKALREESLLKGGHNWPPAEAVAHVATALHEHWCAEWDHTMDEQKSWDTLPVGAKQMELKNATWLIGRLALAGFRIVKIR